MIQVNLAKKAKIVNLARDLFSVSFENGDKIVVLGQTPLAGFEIYGRLDRKTLGGILAIDYE